MIIPAGVTSERQKLPEEVSEMVVSEHFVSREERLQDFGLSDLLDRRSEDVAVDDDKVGVLAHRQRARGGLLPHDEGAVDRVRLQSSLNTNNMYKRILTESNKCMREHQF